LQNLTESIIELPSLDWFKDLGCAVLYGGEIAPEEPSVERENYAEVILARRLKSALARINPSVPSEALEDAFPKLTRPRRGRWLVMTAPSIKCWRRELFT